MRGGTSKGLFFNANDLPTNQKDRNALLLAVMGSPDARQIDGMGGAHPLTSKVAILSRSDHPEADVDYLFLQVAVEHSDVSDRQPCGNILAGVGPWAIENGMVGAGSAVTPVRVRTVNNGSLAVVNVQTPGGQVEYEGAAAIDGVPGTAAPIIIEFRDVAGANCGSMLPTGNVGDRINGVDVTCIDNGMPVVLLRAKDFDLSGTESPAELEANERLTSRIEAIRLKAGMLMNLGDVAGKTVPKMTLIAPPQNGGTVSTRTFIPHRVHDAIGVFGAVSVGAACMLSGSLAHEIAVVSQSDDLTRLDIEHPTGFFTVEMAVMPSAEGLKITRSALLRTARLLMRGQVYATSISGRQL